MMPRIKLNFMGSEWVADRLAEEVEKWPDGSRGDIVEAMYLA